MKKISIILFTVIMLLGLLACNKSENQSESATNETNQNNVITYTASSRLTEVPNEDSCGLHINAFNTTLSGHTFLNGQGAIRFIDNVTKVGDLAFFRSKELTSVTLPNSVTCIGEGAFSRCKMLTSITLPNSLIRIEDGAFARCCSLPSISIPNSVTIIGEGAFSKCRLLTSVILPVNITRIENGTFYKCTSLTSVTLSNNVYYIDQSAFEGCNEHLVIRVPVESYDRFREMIDPTIKIETY